MQNIDPVLKLIGSKELPFEHRKKTAIDLIADEKTGEAVLAKLASESLDKETQEMAEEIRGIVANLQRAPMKPATFVELITMDGSTTPVASVLMDNGEPGYMVVHDVAAAKQLQCGDRIALDGKAKILIGQALEGIYHCGKEARFERRLDERHIEVIGREERSIVLTHHNLGDITPGDTVIIGPGERMAIAAIPQVDALNYCRFLDRGAVPDVIVGRDIGAPPAVIEAVSRHVWEEMTRPELRRRFRLRPCITRLLCGVSGSGKTLAVQAIHRRIYEIMSEVTGMAMEELPHRVFKFKTSQILSMWLGESDKNADRLFDEVEKLAAERFTNKKGKKFTLPVMVVMEEAEGIGRARGGDRDGIYDRILTTLLQRLDPNRAGLGDKLVVFLSTTNEPHLVDPAFLRRIGGQVEHFGRLDRNGFVDVLKKHVEGLPAQNGTGKTQKTLWKEIVQDLEAWLYDDIYGSTEVVELVASGMDSSVIKRHRDFMTGALIDRSVQQASTVAWEASLRDPDAGIQTAHLQHAITHQVENVAAQLTPTNVVHYLDLPEGLKVTKIRSLSRK